jgi:hypothetical protein
MAPLVVAVLTFYQDKHLQISTAASGKRNTGEGFDPIKSNFLLLVTVWQHLWLCGATCGSTLIQ